MSAVMALASGHIYVAELRFPSSFYISGDERGVIPNPNGFGINKGYWLVRPRTEQVTIERHSETVLITEFVSESLKEAEDLASIVGRTFQSIVSAHFGYPFELARLHRIASVDPYGCLISHHNYVYQDKPYVHTGFGPQAKYDFQKYLEFFSSTTDETRFPLQSAIHWYEIAMTVDDPTVSYVAAWTGLESIGLVMNRHFHSNGEKAPCMVCGNRVGIKRDRKKSGIDHILKLVTNGRMFESLPQEAKDMISSQVTEGLSADKAAEVRNNVVHAKKEIDVLVQECIELRRHLIHALSASINIAMGPLTKSWVPGDFEFHPSARYSLKFNNGLKKSPYHGEWVGNLRTDVHLIDPDLGKAYSSTWDRSFTVDSSIVEFIDADSGVVFKRPQQEVYSLPDEEVVSGLTTWEARPNEPTWEDVTASRRGLRFENLNARSGT